LKGEIEERKKSEKQLAHSERKYRQLAESIPDVIWTTDMDFRFTYVSPAAIQLQGWTPEEFLNLRVQDVLPPESYAKAVAEFNTRLELAEKTGGFSRSSTLEVEMLHKSGSTVWTEVTASFLLGEDNRPIGVLGVTRDIRERRRVQKRKSCWRAWSDPRKWRRSARWRAGSPMT
jgi:PAS domain S-box-containing protein